MYLSCLLIEVGANPDRPRPGRLWLRNLYHVHQRLCMAFPSEDKISGDAEFLSPFRLDDFRKGDQVHVPRQSEHGFLFRVDPLTRGGAAVIVQSAVTPDWDYAFHNAGYLLAAPPEVRPFDPHFDAGERLRFRLVVNPTRKIDTKSAPDGVRRNGRRVPVRTEDMYGWLSRRAEERGFSLSEDSTTIEPGYAYADLDRKGCRLRLARCDGVLTVTDPERFESAIVQGIGPAKALGCGLLSVAALRPSGD